MGHESRGYANEEISLLDLLLVLNRRKWIIGGIFLLCIAIALITTQWLKDKELYAYTSVIEIGTVAVEGELRSTDSISNLTAKIKEAYLPQLESQMSESVDISVDSPKGSNLIILQSTASESGLHDKYSVLHNELLALIQRNEQERISKLGAAGFSATEMLLNMTEKKVHKKSQSPVLMTTLGAFMGLFLGVFVAFFVEFTANVRQQLRQRQESGV